MKITGTIIKNESSGKFLAFINEYSGIIAQGSSSDEAKFKLNRNFKKFINYMDTKGDSIKYVTEESF